MAGDPLWHYKVLGLHCNGTNGSTTFTDVKGKTVTAVGNAQISTAQYPALTGKTSSALFDGAGDFLTVPDSSDFTLGSGAFTLRARIYLTGYAPNESGQYAACVIGKDIPTSRAFIVSILGTASSYTDLSFYGFADNATYTIVTEAYSFSLNTWYAIEVTRSGNLIYLFVDGVLLNSGGTAFSRDIQASTTTLKIGALDYSASYKYYFPGYISEVEIYKGVALHTGTYTPSSDQFSDEYVYVSGVTKDASDAFASRLVRVYRRDTGALVSSVLSNGTTGAYKVTAVNSGGTSPIEHFAICFDATADPPGTPTRNAQIFDNITPF